MPILAAALDMNITQQVLVTETARPMSLCSCCDLCIREPSRKHDLRHPCTPHLLRSAVFLVFSAIALSKTTTERAARPLVAGSGRPAKLTEAMCALQQCQACLSVSLSRTHARAE